MSAFTAGVLIQAAFAGISGAAILFFRVRILRFVRARYEKVYREDEMDDDEIRTRLPKMWVVVLIGLGCLGVATIAAGVGMGEFDAARDESGTFGPASLTRAQEHAELRGWAHSRQEGAG